MLPLLILALSAAPLAQDTTVAAISRDTLLKDSAAVTSAAPVLPVMPAPSLAPQKGDTTKRRHAVEYSDAYATRLTIHRIGSYTMLPLFVGEYYLGDKLLNGQNIGSWVKPAHVAVATGIGALFAVNTVTGLWNLAESWQDPAGRGKRLVHTLLMVGSEAGFLTTAAIAGNARRDRDAGVRHRNVALGSFGVATVGTALMWFFK